MARQDSIIKLKGQLDDVSFFKTKKGYQARAKKGVDGSRIKNDASFERTRENNSEFGRAGKAGKLLRTSLRALISKVGSGNVSSRLTGQFLKVIKADGSSVRGQRNVIDGEVELLSGFEFNLDGRLNATFFAQFTAMIDRATGVLSIVIPAFSPKLLVAAPVGSTHFKLTSAGVEIDFEQETYAISTADSAEIETSLNDQPEVRLTNNLVAASTKPLFLAFGIEFSQLVNGVHYPLNNGTFNALALVAVDGGV